MPSLIACTQLPFLKQVINWLMNDINLDEVKIVVVNPECGFLLLRTQSKRELPIYPPPSPQSNADIWSGNGTSEIMTLYLLWEGWATHWDPSQKWPIVEHDLDTVKEVLDTALGEKSNFWTWYQYTSLLHLSYIIYKLGKVFFYLLSQWSI